jgi:hypothetical protein
MTDCSKICFVIMPFGKKAVGDQMVAARVREGQSKEDPPFDRPWCFFDLAEIKLYQGIRTLSRYRQAGVSGVR